MTETTGVKTETWLKWSEVFGVMGVEEFSSYSDAIASAVSDEGNEALFAIEGPGGVVDRAVVDADV